MRQYIRILFGLLLPLSGLFMVISTLYYNQGNEFSEALKLGVLTGFFIAISLSPFIAFFIYLMRRPTRTKSYVSSHTKSSRPKPIMREKTKLIQKKKKVNLSNQEKKTTSSSDEKIILLMDQELTINILLYAIGMQDIGKVSQNKGENHSIKLDSNQGLIEFIISPLTRHTSEITIESGKNTVYAEKILSYTKEKEYSFLDY